MSKPVPGHKCAGAVLSVRVKCECDWSSGARKNAYAEWRSHCALGQR